MSCAVWFPWSSARGLGRAWHRSFDQDCSSEQYRFSDQHCSSVNIVLLNNVVLLRKINVLNAFVLLSKTVLLKNAVLMLGWRPNTCQVECGNGCRIECQIECQKNCQVECQIESRLQVVGLCLYLSMNIECQGDPAVFLHFSLKTHRIRISY